MPFTTDQFVARLGFSLQKTERINIPSGSLIYDFEHTRGLEMPDRSVEETLRRIAMEYFKQHFGKDRCVFLDVNHDSYYFIPNELTLNPECEPWPSDLSPGYNFVSLSDSQFSTGFFSDWGPTLRVIVYGNVRTSKMRDGFPMKPLQQL
jgi:hypothetical protein